MSTGPWKRPYGNAPRTSRLVSRSISPWLTTCCPPGPTRPACARCWALLDNAIRGPCPAAVPWRWRTRNISAGRGDRRHHARGPGRRFHQADRGRQRAGHRTGTGAAHLRAVLLDQGTGPGIGLSRPTASSSNSMDGSRSPASPAKARNLPWFLPEHAARAPWRRPRRRPRSRPASSNWC